MEFDINGRLAVPQMEQTISASQFKGIEPIISNDKEKTRLAQLKEEIVRLGKCNCVNRFVMSYFFSDVDFDLELVRGRISKEMVTDEIGKLKDEPSPEFENEVDRLRWVINASANQNEMTEKTKGELFAKYVQSIRARFGLRVSTELLKSLCDKSIDNTALHISYLMRLAGLITLPTYNYPLRRVFDLVYSPTESDLIEKSKRQEDFREECLNFWLAKASPEEQAKIKEFEASRILAEVGPEEL